jgi:hypothetical protein
MPFVLVNHAAVKQLKPVGVDTKFIIFHRHLTVYYIVRLLTAVDDAATLFLRNFQDDDTLVYVRIN